MRAKKLATATKSIRLHTATAPTNGQALICSDASGDEIIAAWGNPATLTTTADTITDNSTGTASVTVAAGAGVSTVTIPLTSLATGLGTGAIDLLTNYTPGYRFKLLGFHFVTTVAGTGTSASQVFNLEIGTTNVTGGVLTLLLADTDTIGKVTAATAITAANTGTAADTLSIEMAASGTVFTAGAGYFAIKIQNMDTADAIASIVTEYNELLADITT